MYFDDDYIAMIPSYTGTDFHKHGMLHIFLSDDKICVRLHNQEYRGHFIVLDSWVDHQVNMPLHSLFYLIDPGSMPAVNLRKHFLNDEKYYISNTKIAHLSSLNAHQLKQYSRQILEHLGLYQHKKDPRDERIIRLMKDSQSGILSTMEIKDIAERFHLSESRLSHLFKAETGMNLKNYMVMMRMKKAFMLINSGQSFTEAAVNAAFYDSAHLCKVVKKYTGITVSDVFKKS